MNVEKYTKKTYDIYGKEYQKTREEKHKSRLYNEFLEVPCMVKAVGNIKNKKLLDIGCGAGVHIKKYLKKGAKCQGIDISRTMIEMARKNCPSVNFKTGSISKLPYKNSSFDIVTASLCIDYIDNLYAVFKEVNRVLKQNGLFYYSNESIIASARERYEDKDCKISGIGRFTNKKTGKKIALGQAWHEGLCEWEMVPGMIMKTYHKTFRTQLHALRKANFEFTDIIDCKPVLEFKKHDSQAYKTFTKFPLFNIYIARKK